MKYVIGMCPYCLGAGANEIKDSRSAELCERCNSSGRMVFKPHDGLLGAGEQQLAVCPECDGDLESVRQTCQVCQGRGLEIYARGGSIRICILCEGLTGFKQCTMCEGDGFVRVDPAFNGRQVLSGVDWLQLEDGTRVSYSAWHKGFVSDSVRAADVLKKRSAEFWESVCGQAHPAKRLRQRIMPT